MCGVADRRGKCGCAVSAADAKAEVGTYAKHDKQLQEDGKCEKNDRADCVWNADL
jgi:hypothetical protein